MTSYWYRTIRMHCQHQKFSTTSYSNNHSTCAIIYSSYFSIICLERLHPIHVFIMIMCTFILQIPNLKIFQISTFWAQNHHSLYPTNFFWSCNASKQPSSKILLTSLLLCSPEIGARVMRIILIILIIMSFLPCYNYYLSLYVHYQALIKHCSIVAENFDVVFICVCIEYACQKIQTMRTKRQKSH